MWIGDKFHLQELDATAGIYNYEDKSILITYGLKDGYNYTAIISDNLQTLGEIEIVAGNAYISGDSENTGEWKIEVITADNQDGQYNGSIGTARIIGYYGTYGDVSIPNIVYAVEDGIRREYMVTEIGSNIFAYCNIPDDNAVTSIKFSEGLVKIGARCFLNDNLISNTVVFPKTLKYIGEYAFSDCSNMIGDLDSISKQNISKGKNAFYKCKKMTGNIELIMPSKEDDGTYLEDVMQAFQISNNDTSYYGIPEGFLSGCAGLTGELIIPNFIEVIEDNAFYGCTGITSIDFSEATKLIKIGDSAFYNCNNNTADISFCFVDNNNDEIPDLTIGKNAFYQASGGQIDLSNVQKIDTYCFYKYVPKGNNLYSFISSEKTILKPNEEVAVRISSNTISNAIDLQLGGFINNLSEHSFESVKIRYAYTSSATMTFGSYSFQNSTISKFESKYSNISNIVDMGTSAFYGCSYLEKIENMSGVGHMGWGCFHSCKLLEKSPYAPTSLDWATFNGCNSLESVDLSACTNISQSLNFSNCCNLKEIKYSATQLATSDITVVLRNLKIRSIPEKTFAGCYYLGGTINGKLLNKEEKEIIVGNGAFSETLVSYANEVTLETELDTQTNIIYGIIYPDSKINASDTSNNKISANKYSSVTKFKDSSGNKINNLKVDDSVKIIESSSFAYSSFESIVIPNTVEDIGGLAFYNDQELKKVTLPSNNKFTNIRNKVFSYCDALETINMPSSVKTVGDQAFRGCSSLKSVNLENVTNIGAQAFELCDLSGDFVFPTAVINLSNNCFRGTKINKDIVIPNTVTSFGGYVFESCVSLKNITLNCNLNAVPSSTFSGCSGLKSVNFTNSNITSISGSAFNGCSLLNSISGITWTNLTTIGASALKNCSSLSGTITLNSNCNFDSETSFNNCGYTLKFN